MNRWLGAAFACGIVPVVIGVMIFLIWVLVPAPILIDAGLVWLLAGTVLILAGIVLAVIYTVLSLRRRTASRRQLRRRVLALLILYVANFLIAGLVATAANKVKGLADRYTVTVVNHTSVVLEDARLKAPGIEVRYYDIQPGQEVRREFLLPHEGHRMEFSCQYGDEQLKEITEGYFLPGTVLHGTVTIEPHGEIRTDYEQRND